MIIYIYGNLAVWQDSCVPYRLRKENIPPPTCSSTECPVPHYLSQHWHPLLMQKRVTEENSLHNSHKNTENYDRNKPSNKFIPFRKKKARRIEVNRSIHKMDHSKGCNFKENHSKGCRISKKILTYFSYSRSMNSNPRKLLKMLYQWH